LYTEQYGFCAYCFNKMTLQKDQPLSATVDHVVPRMDGGQDVRENFVAACHTCNNRKLHLPLVIFLLNEQRRKAGLPPSSAKQQSVRPLL
jgi:5-methylcytosine-specific restriction endonuclease McrA